MFGNSPEPQSEKTTLKPNSPYAAAKLYAHEITRIYRESFGIFASTGILFNHESEVRGQTFVTRKITKGLVKIKLGKQKKLVLGNLYAKRDWGYAPDYVESMWKILQHKKPDDFVIATGKSYSVKDFIIQACKILGIEIKFSGKGLNEFGYTKNGDKIIEVNKRYFRPLEVNLLRGNYSKARKTIRWRPKTSFNQLVKIMIDYDYQNEIKS